MRIRARLASLLLTFVAVVANGADNELTEAERKSGWQLLFDGATLDGWMTSDGKPSERPVEEGAINPHRCGGYMLVYHKPQEDFTLRCDFKLSPKCNSGVFVRTSSLEPRRGKDVGFNGIEIALDDTQEHGFHDTGAMYDLAAPSKNAMRPAGEWNTLEITCDGHVIDVTVNGEAVNHVDLGQFSEANRRPDGSEHKFDVVYRDHPTRGYIGLQDHGADCWFKNIRLKPLKSGKSP
jgi:hypothetical protein